MEQKHTPYYYVDTQFGDRYCLMDGNDMSKKGAYRMLDEIKKVAELTKENEKLQLENAWENSEQLQEIKALTEQVESLKAENKDLKQLVNSLSCHD